MSDETPPPSLRLKPRQRPDAGTPPAAPAAAPAPVPAAAPDPDGGKLRLKPKLAGETPAAAVTPVEVPVESAPPPSPPAGDRIRLKPKLNQEPAQAAAAQVPAEPAPAPAAEIPEPPAPPSEDGKIKLKIKVPGAAVEAAAAVPEAEAAAPGTGAPPPFPMVVPGSAMVGGAAPGKPPLRSGAPRPGAPRPGAPVRRLPPSVLAASARKKRIWKLLLVAVGGLVMAAGIIGLAYVKFIEPPPPLPKPKPVEVRPEIPVTPPVTDADTTKAAVPAADQVERAPAHPVHPHSKPTMTTATTDLAPGVTITTESVEAETEASPAFRSFVADAKISGVFQGTPPRAFINGRLVRLGEVVDSLLGVRFDSIDPKTKNIVFKDSTGATVARRY